MASRRAIAAGTRLGTGLILVSFVVTHFLNHSLGIISLATMEAGREIFVAVWRNPVTYIAVPTTLVLHILFAGGSVLRRRTLKMSLQEALRVGLALLIPTLLLAHLGMTRLVQQFYAIDDAYAFILLQFFPAYAWFFGLLILVVWSHGILGLHLWLRPRPWYPKLAPWLLAFAILWPTLAYTGFIAGGREVERLAADPTWHAAILARSPLSVAEYREVVLTAYLIALAAILTTVGLAFVTRAVYLYVERRRRSIPIRYHTGQIVNIAPGTSILEASRIHNIPHASICGGRGRCTTCRVLINLGNESLEPPAAGERKVLERIGAMPRVRLGCQVRPTQGLFVTPLLHPGAKAGDGLANRVDAGGREAEVVIMFADLRGFTTFSEHRLPYDVVFVLNQYFQHMGEAIEWADGYVDKFIGDGIMAIFGAAEKTRSGVKGVPADTASAAARNAIAASVEMVKRLAYLNESLKHDLEGPLQIGIGLHQGPVILGEMGYGRTKSLTAIGDTVNTASRLEQATKTHGCQLVVSAAVAAAAGRDLSRFHRHELNVRGREQTLTAYAIPTALDLEEPVTAP